MAWIARIFFEEALGTDPDHLVRDDRPARAPTSEEQEFMRHSFNVDQAADYFDVSADTVRHHLYRGDLLGFQADGQWWLPRWQFFEDVHGGMLVGLKELQNTAGCGTLRLTRWVLLPHSALGGRCPRDLLVEGRVDQVLALARSERSREK